MLKNKFKDVKIKKSKQIKLFRGYSSNGRTHALHA